VIEPHVCEVDKRIEELEMQSEPPDREERT